MGCNSSKASAAAPKTLLAEAKAGEDPTKPLSSQGNVASDDAGKPGKQDANLAVPVATQEGQTASMSALSSGAELEGVTNVEDVKVEEEPKEASKVEVVEGEEDRVETVDDVLQESKEKGDLEGPVTTQAVENTVTPSSLETKPEGGIDVEESKLEDEPKQDTKGQLIEGEPEDPTSIDALVEMSVIRTSGWCSCK
jgi:hypothetical protein